MKGSPYCHRLRLADVSAPWAAELGWTVRSPQALLDKARTLLQQCERSVWITGRTSGSRQVMTALFGLQAIDKDSRHHWLHFFPVQRHLDKHTLQQVIDQAMNQGDVFRLDLAVDPGHSRLLALLEETGWQQEGRLRSAHHDPDQGRHLDRLLYALLRPDQDLVSVALVPFRLAVLALISNRQALTEATFIRYGQPCASARLQEVLAKADLLDARGALLEREAVAKTLAPGGCWMTDRAPAFLGQAVEQLKAYFKGQRSGFEVPLAFGQASRFQQDVWQALMAIPHGQTRSYAAVATAVSGGNEQEGLKKARAVGAACSANPLALFVPCHRVVGKGGKLVGFTGGLDIKEYLLAHEILGLSD